MSDLEGVLLSDYLLLQCISKGGLADVYRARQQSEGNFEVAVKVYRPNYAQQESFRDYFMAEAEKVGQFDHPHILPCLEFGEGEGLLYAVIPYIATGTLDELLSRAGGKISPTQALPIMQQVCSAVQYAHNHDVIHGNIKPSNIFVTNDGRMLLGDFGIARGYDGSQQSLTGIGWGTAEYTAPEQSLGVLRKASDIYALGVLLFRLLTGQTPFSGQTPVEVLLKHVRQPTPSARMSTPSISDAVDGVLHMALQKRADDRFASAEELSNAFFAAVTVSPAAAPAVQTDDPLNLKAFAAQAVEMMYPQMEQSLQSPQTPIPPPFNFAFISEAQTPLPPQLAFSTPVSSAVRMQENFGSSSFLQEPSPQSSQPWYTGSVGSVGSMSSVGSGDNSHQPFSVVGNPPEKNRSWQVDPVEWSPISNGQVNVAPSTAEDYLRDQLIAPVSSIPLNCSIAQTPAVQPVQPPHSDQQPLFVSPIPIVAADNHKQEDDTTLKGQIAQEAQELPKGKASNGRMQRVLPILVVILLLIGLLAAFLSSFFFPASGPGAYGLPHITYSLIVKMAFVVSSGLW